MSPPLSRYVSRRRAKIRIDPTAPPTEREKSLTAESDKPPEPTTSTTPDPLPLPQQQQQNPLTSAVARIEEEVTKSVRTLQVQAEKSLRHLGIELSGSARAPPTDSGSRFPDDPVYTAMIIDIETAIDQGIYPELIPTGSSGSYFVRNSKKQMVGVFKPKDEEPFAPLNPKWPKAIQRFFSPCCFGRKCLLTDHGYLSEVGASVVDEWLELNVVPKTRLVWLASPTFNYPKRMRNRPLYRLPPKAGSLQMFMHGYENAGKYLEPNVYAQMPDYVKQQLKTLTQRMIVLDYIIRNTDRSHANWMIKYTGSTIQENKTDTDDDTQTQSRTKTEQRKQQQRRQQQQQQEHQQQQTTTINIAAIDNGLAFPLRHPVEQSRVRTFPFYWATLPMAKEPFEPELCERLLLRLDNPQFVFAMCNELRHVFKQDPGYNTVQFKAQMRVMRGQIANLRESLKAHESPSALAIRPPLIALKTKHQRSRKAPRTGIGTGAAGGKIVQKSKSDPAITDNKPLMAQSASKSSRSITSLTEDHQYRPHVHSQTARVGDRIIITTSEPTQKFEEHFKVQPIEKAQLCGCCGCTLM